MAFRDKNTERSQIADLIVEEEERQRSGLELIASENYISSDVMRTMATVLNNKYSEGYPGKRYYGGNEIVDQIEQLAIDRAIALFGGEHANVQPHAGAPANMATYFALAKPGDTILGMKLSHGGHLTHGHPVTHLAGIFKFVRYGMADIETGEIDYDELRAVAHAEKPQIVLAGFSSYPRNLDYGRISEIAREVGAYAVADIAHIAGLIAAKALANPFDFGFDVLVTTTHKSLRGPRGGMIISRTAEIGKKVDKAVFPGLQGGPIVQMIAAKAVALEEAARPSFTAYADQVLRNAKTLAAHLMANGVKLVTNGTDNHLLLIDAMQSWGLSGAVVQTKLDQVGISVNMNVVPDDARPPMDPSGVRLGTPAVTSRGLSEADMITVGDFMIWAAKGEDLLALRQEVETFSRKFPLPGYFPDRDA